MPDALASARTLVGSRVVVARGTQHRHYTRYGGHIGSFGSERALDVVDVCEDKELGVCLVYEVPKCRPPFYDEEREHWRVPASSVLKILDPGQDERRRLSALCA